eukprot:scaffold111093_cov45-Phaeocystis_antarctica.AAC.1
MEAYRLRHRYRDCRSRALGGRRVQALKPAARRSSGCHRGRWQRGGRGAQANRFVDHLGTIGGQWGCDGWRGGRGGLRGERGWRRGRGRERWMDPLGHGGSGGRWRQACCRGGSPGVTTPSATGGERRQSRLVLGLLRLRERLPVLAWGMWQGAGAVV